MNANQTQIKDFAALFADLDLDAHEEWLHHKREDTAITLTGMLWQSGVNRADLARKLDWKPSRVTRALSGKENLTINTLAEIINAAGYDFDLLLRKRDECRGFQPWEKEAIKADILDTQAQLKAKLAEVKDHCDLVRTMLETTRLITQRAFRNAPKSTTNAFVANSEWSDDDARRAA